MDYRNGRWPKRKVVFSGKPNAELREYLYRRQITHEQLGAWCGVAASAISRWLNEPLTDERRQKIEAGLDALLKQREGR